MSMYREMRRAKQEISGEACRRVLEEARFGTLALSLEDGMPYAVPVSFAFDKESSALYFHGAAEGQKADAVRRDPRACFKIASGNSRQFNCRDESEPASSAATHCLACNKIL